MEYPSYQHQDQNLGIQYETGPGDWRMQPPPHQAVAYEAKMPVTWKYKRLKIGPFTLPWYGPCMYRLLPATNFVKALIFGFALDFSYVRRTTRAKIAWLVMFILTFVIWGGGYVFQTKYDRQSSGDGAPKRDWTSDGYIGPMFLYIFYGFYDAAWQTCVYWLMGAISNNSRKLANFAGFYKGIQSAGAAIMWRLDSYSIPYMNLFASCWILLAGSLVLALPVILVKIKDTVPIEEDLKFTDETIDDVIGQQIYYPPPKPVHYEMG